MPGFGTLGRLVSARRASNQTKAIMKLNGLELTKRERDFLATSDINVLTNFNVVRNYSDRPNEFIQAIEAEGIELSHYLAEDDYDAERRYNLLGDEATPHLPSEEESEQLNQTIFSSLLKIAQTVFSAAKLKPGKYTIDKLASTKMEQAPVVDCACEEFSPAGIEFDGVNVETILDGTALRVDAGTFKCSFAKTKLFEVLKNFASAHGFTVAQFVKAADDESTLEQLQGAEYACIVTFPFSAKMKKYCKEGVSVDVSAGLAVNMACDAGVFLTPCDAREICENKTGKLPCFRPENINGESIFTVRNGESSDEILYRANAGFADGIKMFKAPVFELAKKEVKEIQRACKNKQAHKYQYTDIECTGGTLRVKVPQTDNINFVTLEFAHDGEFSANIGTQAIATFADWDGRIFIHDKGSFLFLACPFGLVQTGVMNGGTAPTGETINVADYLHDLAAQPAKRPARRRKATTNAPAEPATDVPTTAPAAVPTGGTSDVPATPVQAAPRKRKATAKRNSDDTKAAQAPAKRANVWPAEQFNKAYDEMKFISMIIRWCVMICAYFIAGETARTQIRLSTLLNLSARANPRQHEETPAKATETTHTDAQATDGVPTSEPTDRATVGPAREPTDTDGKAGAGGFVPPPTTAPEAAPQPNDLPAPAIAPPARGGHRRRARPNDLARRTVWPQVRRRAPTTKAPERFAYPNCLHRTRISVCHLPRGSPDLRPFPWPYQGFYASNVQFQRAKYRQK